MYHVAISETCHGFCKVKFPRFSVHLSFVPSTIDVWINLAPLLNLLSVVGLGRSLAVYLYRFIAVLNSLN